MAAIAIPVPAIRTRAIGVPRDGSRLDVAGADRRNERTDDDEFLEVLHDMKSSSRRATFDSPAQRNPLMRSDAWGAASQNPRWVSPETAARALGGEGQIVRSSAGLAARSPAQSRRRAARLIGLDPDRDLPATIGTLRREPACRLTTSNTRSDPHRSRWRSPPAW
jgi:hypothetical protein